MDISIVIVTYNSESLIGDCVKSIISTCKKNTFEIIMSDNSPNHNTEDVVKKLQATHKNITFIYNDANLGFSKANNIGIKKTKGRYLLFLNPDTKVYKDTIDGMVEFMDKTPDAGTATCFMELASGELDDASHRGFPTPWRSFCYFSGLAKQFPQSKLFAGYNLTFMDFNTTHEIDALAGSFMIVPRKVGEKLHWWDEDFFFYGEDIDFCFRIKKMGLKVYFVPEFKSLHYKGVSSGIKKASSNITKASLETKLKVTDWRFHAMEIFYDKHYKKKYPLFINFLIKFAIRMKWIITKYQIQHA